MGGNRTRPRALRRFCGIRLPMKDYSLGKVVRAADGAGLENQCAVTPYQEFESLTFREQCPQLLRLTQEPGAFLRPGVVGALRGVRCPLPATRRIVGRSGRMRQAGTARSAAHRTVAGPASGGGRRRTPRPAGIPDRQDQSTADGPVRPRGRSSAQSAAVLIARAADGVGSPAVSRRRRRPARGRSGEVEDRRHGVSARRRAGVHSTEARRCDGVDTEDAHRRGRRQ